MGHYAPPPASHGSNKHLPPALFAFPSPASITPSLSSPVFDKPFSDSLASSAQQTPRYGLDDTAGIVPTLPGSIRSRPLMSPPADESAEPDMNTIVGGALAPVPSKSPARPSLRAGSGLRLPSFDELGIAAPHPDRHGVDNLDRTFSHAAREAMREPFSAPHFESSLAAAFQDTKIGGEAGDTRCGQGAAHCLSPGRAVKAPVPRYVETLTPPAERHEPDWNINQAVDSAPMGQSAGEPEAAGQLLESVTLNAESAATTLPSRPANTDDSTQPRAWYDGAVDALRKCPRSSSNTDFANACHSGEYLLCPYPQRRPEDHLARFTQPITSRSRLPFDNQPYQ